MANRRARKGSRSSRWVCVCVCFCVRVCFCAHGPIRLLAPPTRAHTLAPLAPVVVVCSAVAKWTWRARRRRHLCVQLPASAFVALTLWCMCGTIIGPAALVRIWPQCVCVCETYLILLQQQLCPLFLCRCRCWLGCCCWRRWPGRAVVVVCVCARVRLLAESTIWLRAAASATLFVVAVGRTAAAPGTRPSSSPHRNIHMSTEGQARALGPRRNRMESTTRAPRLRWRAAVWLLAAVWRRRWPRRHKESARGGQRTTTAPELQQPNAHTHTHKSSEKFDSSSSILFSLLLVSSSLSFIVGLSLVRSALSVQLSSRADSFVRSFVWCAPAAATPS